MWEEAKTRITKIQHTVYEVGDKAGKLLAWLDKREQANRWVAQLTLDTGTIVTDPQQIVNTFAHHYETIYTPITTTTLDDGLAFLKDIRMPTLTLEEAQALDADLMSEELSLAIGGIQTGKALVPNGIPIELYKKAAAKLTPHLLKM